MYTTSTPTLFDHSTTSVRNCLCGRVLLSRCTAHISRHWRLKSLLQTETKTHNPKKNTPDPAQREDLRRISFLQCFENIFRTLGHSTIAVLPAGHKPITIRPPMDTQRASLPFLECFELF
jgi:hypothetical protein